MKVIVNLLFMLFLLITHSTSSPTSKRRSNAPFSAPKYPEWVQPILDAMVDSVKMDKVRSSIAPRLSNLKAEIDSFSVNSNQKDQKEATKF